MHSTKSENLSTAIIFILFGLVLCIFNVSILTTITKFIGVAALVVSLFFFYTYYKKRETTTFASLFIGLCLLAFGIYMTFFSEQFISAVPMLMGIVLIVNSFVHFQKMLILKDNGYENWKFNLGSAIFILIVGIILLLKPVQSLAIIFKLTGSFLILNAIMILIYQYQLDKIDSTCPRLPRDDS